MRASLIAVALAIGVLAPGAVIAAPPPRQGATGEATPDELLQKEADRHFKSGVALYRDAKYAEALDEFERAYEIAPHPLVLFNIAECHRDLLHYAEAVASYRRFLVEGNGRVPAARLAAAQAELDALIALIARVTVTIVPASEDAVLILDGRELDRPVMPLILPPGEHRLIARAAGRRDAARTLQLSAGDSLAVQLELGELPRVAVERVVTAPAPGPALALDAGFGMNLRRVGKTGAPSIGLRRRDRLAVRCGRRLRARRLRGGALAPGPGDRRRAVAPRDRRRADCAARRADVGELRHPGRRAGRALPGHAAAGGPPGVVRQLRGQGPGHRRPHVPRR